MLLLTFRKLVWEMRGNCDGKLESKGGPQPQTRAYLEKIYPQAKLQKEKERSSQSEGSSGGCGPIGGQSDVYSSVL